MAKALYNPKYTIGLDGKKVLNIADVKGFIWSHARWDLKVGELKRFPDEVGSAMLRHMEFLVEVTPKNLKEIKSLLAEKKFKCEKCEFGTDTKVAFFTHVKTQHGATEEQLKEFESVDEAVPAGKFYGVKQGQEIKPEQKEGIPKGETRDRQGVEWYGEGVENDRI